MSDLTATNCGCSNNSNCCGNNSCGNFIWIIILLFLFNGNCSGLLSSGCNNDCDNGCGCNGLFGGNNNSCSWLIWILLISCFCGNNNSCC